MSQSNLTVRSDTGVVGIISSQTKISQKDISLADSSPACGNSTRCKSSGGILGYEEHLWKCTVDFSNYGTNCSFTLSWEQAIRSNVINTGQAGQNFYIQSYINLCYDSSGREIRKFNSPSLAFPYNTDFKYNPDFRDRTNYFDSISYVLSPSLVSRNTSATYSGNFNAFRPMSFFGFPNSALGFPAGFRLNAISGNLEFRPTQVNQFGSISFHVQGWKKHNDTMRLVGWAQEDFIPVIITTSGVSSPNISLSREPVPIRVCANTTACIEVRVEGYNSSDTLLASWIKEDSLMTVDTLSWQPGLIKLRVCFTPDTSRIRDKPYMFGIRSWEYACYFIKKASLNYGFVVTAPLDSSKKPLWQTSRTCNQLRIHAYDTSNSGRPLFVRTDSGAYQNDTLDIALSDTGWHRFHIKQVQDGCDLIFTDSVRIDSLYHFTTQVISPYKTCSNTSLTLHPVSSGGLGFTRYMWPDSSTLDSFTFTVTGDTTLWVKSTDSSGCTLSDTFDVRMNQPVYTNTPPIPICDELPNDTVRLKTTVSGGTTPYSYTWIGQGNGNNFPLIPPLADTVYLLEVMDSIGCTVRDSLLLDRYTPHYPLATHDTTGCFLAAIYLKPLNKVNTGSYSWLGMGAGDSLRFYPPLGIHEKVLRYTDSLSCQTYDTVRIANHATPNFSLPNDTVICAGTSLQIDATLYSGKAPINYSWFPYTSVTDSFIQDIFTQSSRIYLELSDSTGCSRIDSMDVLIGNIPQIAAASPQKMCTADSMLFLSGISGSVSGIWKGSGVVNQSGTGYWFDGRNKGPGTYSLTFEAQNASGNCSASELLEIELYPSPLVEAGADTGLCGGGLIGLEAIGSGGTGTYSFIWNQDTSENKALFFPTIVQDSMHRVVLTDSIGCTATDSVHTFKWPFPEAVFISPLTDTAVCAGNPVTILADTLINGAGHSFTFSYGIGNGSFVPDSSFTLYLHVISIKGCADSVSRRITRNENPEITSIKGASFCEDQGQILLDTFASPAGGVWAGQAVSQNNGSFEFSTDSAQSGTSFLYYLLMDTLTGCSDMDSSRMDIEEKTSVDFTADSTLGRVSLTSQFSDLSTGGLKTDYLWSFGDGDSSILRNPSHFYANPGTYDVRLRIAGNKCVSEKLKVGFIQVDTASGPGIGMDEWREHGIAVYPNPSERSFVLSGVSENAFIQVYDARGREIAIQTNPLSDGQLELDFIGHPEAVYLLRVTMEDKTFGIRLVLGSGF
ncbi:MAG TPA: hypothetical protein DIW47_01985 [Bacteroidetes bacterium]|nr:hypothetical protein [Bacteroidota bacterium]